MKVTLFKNIKFNHHSILESIIGGDVDDNDNDDHFLISDYYSDATKNTINKTFTIKYKNHPTYSMPITLGHDNYFNGQSIQKIFDEGKNISLYDFLVNKNMINYYKDVV